MTAMDYYAMQDEISKLKTEREILMNVFEALVSFNDPEMHMDNVSMICTGECKEARAAILRALKARLVPYNWNEEAVQKSIELLELQDRVRMPCIRCQGSGFMVLDSPNHGGPPTYHEPCSFCNSTGFI